MSPLAEATGLLVDGRRIHVAGLTILGPGDAEWVALEPRDFRLRAQSEWVRQVIFHSTWGGKPHRIMPGAGPTGGDKQTLDYFRITPEGKKKSSASQIVIGADGRIACACDLRKVAAFHATMSNNWSIGIEMFQFNDGRIYEATLDAGVKLAQALCCGTGAMLDDGRPWEGFGIPFQTDGQPYRDRPLLRMIDGGPNMAGIFGHRNNTTDRGWGDPGDEITVRLAAAGCELLDFEGEQDLKLWRMRQRILNSQGAEWAKRLGTSWKPLVVDGLYGPSTARAMRVLGVARACDLGA